MQFRMAQNSLFAILLRSGWWMSAAVAVLLAVSALALLPAPYKAVGALSGIPFVVIACIAGWRQWRTPSDAAVQRTIAAARAMSWPELAGALDEAFRSQGYTVERLDGRHGDFRLSKSFRTTLVLARKWKAARTGIEPLRELDAARDATGAHTSMYVTTGEVSENARRFAVERGVQLVARSELARLLPALARGKRTTSR